MPLISTLANASSRGYGMFGGVASTALEGSFYSIATVTVPSGGVSSVTFAGVPTGFRHLQLRGITRSSESTGIGGLYLRFNGDTASNYSWHRLYGNGTAGLIDNASSTTWMLTGTTPTTSDAANMFGSTVTDILDYSSITKNKTIKALSSSDFNGDGQIAVHSGSWYNSSTPVTSLTIAPFNGSWQQYTQFALYGVK